MNTQFTPKMLRSMRNRFHYNSETGKIFKVTENNTLEPCELDIKAGYNVVYVGDGIKIRSHRLAWFLYYGIMPPTDIDHKNRIRSDNRIENLRLTNDSQNAMNSGKHINGSKSMYRGVSWNKSRNCWQAFTYFNKKHIYIGRFDDEKEAALAYILKAKELYPDFFPADYHFDVLANS